MVVTPTTKKTTMGKVVSSLVIKKSVQPNRVKHWSTFRYVGRIVSANGVLHRLVFIVFNSSMFEKDLKPLN